MSPSSALFLLLVAGCTDTLVERGDVAVCLDGGRPTGGGGDTDLVLAGTVSALDAGTATCPWSATIDDGAGTVATIGLGVTDPAGGALTPPVDLTVGAAVELTYRYKLVWGDVAGFVLTDADGVVLAAEEGAWGGALVDGDVPGLAVARDDTVVATEPTECQPIEGYGIVFMGDDALTLTPVASGTVLVDGAPLTAMAVAAYDYGESSNCQVSDITGETSWVVVR